MPTNNWFVWFRYLSATTYYKDCRRPTWLITTQWQIIKVITGMYFATLFIIKYKFDKFNSENYKRTKYATDKIQQTATTNCYNKLLQQTAATNFCNKMLQQTAATNFCNKMLQQTAATNCCNKLLQQLLQISTWNACSLDSKFSNVWVMNLS